MPVTPCHRFAFTLTIVASAAACAGRERRPAMMAASTASSALPAGYAPPPRMKEAGCVARGQLPDPSCTPGAVMTTDAATICDESTQARRNVPASVHREALTEYGYSYPQASGAFEVDHLVPLELGGDNVIANLWAEPAEPVPGFHEKDRVENYLHRQVCSGDGRSPSTGWVRG